MPDTSTVLRELLHFADSSRPCALCTVVATTGSTPQSPGAVMLVGDDGSSRGTLGGGWVEDEVRQQARRSLSSGESRLLDFVLDQDRGADTLLCGGTMDIAVTPFGVGADVGAFRRALEEHAAGRPGSIPLAVRQDDQTRQFVLHLEAPLKLLVVGAGHVGQAVARLGLDLGFAVAVFDDRREYAAAQTFPPGVAVIIDDIGRALEQQPVDASSYVVIATRGHHHDHRALAAVIGKDAAYIGMIGGKRKAKTIFKDLAKNGVPQERLDGVHTPIGLDIGAVTVPEIAVSIAAQLVQERRRRTPSPIEEVPDEA